MRTAGSTGHAAAGWTLLACLLVCCGREPPAAPGPDADPGAAEIAARTPSMGAAVRPVESTQIPIRIPAGFPRDLPTYRGAQPVAALDGGDEFAMVVYEVSDPVATIVAWLEREYAASGWTVEAAPVMDEQRVLLASKGDRSLAATVGPDGGRSRVEIEVLRLRLPHEVAAEP